ncbi:MAG: hypothetical protein HQL76_09420 [Magnetococcales bacterium]|nr:hypothetical protein [Magnetococcales bacterium]
MGRILLVLILLFSAILFFHQPMEEGWQWVIESVESPGNRPPDPGRSFRSRLGNWLTGGGIDAMQGRIGSLEERMTTLSQSLETLQPLRGETSGLRHQVDALQSLRMELTDLRQRIDTLRHDVEQSNSRHDAQGQALQGIVDGLATDLPQRLDTLERQCVAETQEIQRLTREGWRIEHGTHLVEKQDENWKLTDVFFKRRTYRQAITFQTPFSAIPLVQLGMTSLDFSVDEGRMQVSAEEITPQGFILVVESQSSERIRTTGLQWTAFGHP